MFKNWKTTLAGAVGAAAVALQGTDWKHILAAAAMAFIGALAKDHTN